MRVPYRKPGKYSQMKPDHLMTKVKLDELKRKLERLKKIRPEAAAEVARLAELGDFSENAEYQLAKGRLRGINNSILKLESEINNAVIIEAEPNDVVSIGHMVTVEVAGKQRTFHILGSSETNPSRGIISHLSPIGSALLGHKVGDTITIQINNREITYRIIKIV